MEALAQALGVSHAVSWPGFQRDMPGLLAGIDVYVQPSVNEGLSLSILEAMAAEKAVVATRVGGTGEVIVDGKTGVLVPPGSSAALAAAILRLLADPDQRRAISRAGRAHVESTFGLQTMTDGRRALRGALRRGVGAGASTLMARRLDILMVTHHKRFKADGRSGSMAESLVRRGHHVTLLVTSNDRKLGTEVSSSNGVRVVEAPDLLWGRLDVGPGQTGWCSTQDGGRYDLVHCFETRPATIYPARPRPATKAAAGHGLERLVRARRDHLGLQARLVPAVVRENRDVLRGSVPDARSGPDGHLDRLGAAGGRARRPRGSHLPYPRRRRLGRHPGTHRRGVPREDGISA